MESITTPNGDPENNDVRWQILLERLTSRKDRTLRLWDRASGLLLKEMTGHQMDVETVAFTPDGRYIASGGDDGTVKLWDGRSGAFIRDLAKQGGDVTRLVFSPDGRTLLATGGAGDSVCHVFEVASGREISRFSGHTNSVVGAAFSPDGKTVATAGGDRSEIFLWNPETAAVLHKLAGNGSQVWAVAYGQDRKSLAFGLTQKFASQNDRGPLEKTFLLDTDQGGDISEPFCSESECFHSHQRPGGRIRIAPEGG